MHEHPSGVPVLCCVQELFDEERDVEIGAGYTGISIYFENKRVSHMYLCMYVAAALRLLTHPHPPTPIGH